MAEYALELSYYTNYYTNNQSKIRKLAITLRRIQPGLENLKKTPCNRNGILTDGLIANETKEKLYVLCEIKSALCEMKSVLCEMRTSTLLNENRYFPSIHLPILQCFLSWPSRTTGRILCQPRPKAFLT